jgi:hypothetical protein
MDPELDFKVTPSLQKNVDEVVGCPDVAKGDQMCVGTNLLAVDVKKYLAFKNVNSEVLDTLNWITQSVENSEDELKNAQERLKLLEVNVTEVEEDVANGEICLPTFNPHCYSLYFKKIQSKFSQNRSQESIRRTKQIQIVCSKTQHIKNLSNKLREQRIMRKTAHYEDVLWQKSVQLKALETQSDRLLERSPDRIPSRQDHVLNYTTKKKQNADEELLRSNVTGFYRQKFKEGQICEVKMWKSISKMKEDRLQEFLSIKEKRKRQQNSAKKTKLLGINRLSTKCNDRKTKIRSVDYVKRSRKRFNLTTW